MSVLSESVRYERAGDRDRTTVFVNEGRYAYSGPPRMFVEPAEVIRDRSVDVTEADLMKIFPKFAAYYRQNVAWEAAALRYY